MLDGQPPAREDRRRSPPDFYPPRFCRTVSITICEKKDRSFFSLYTWVILSCSIISERYSNFKSITTNGDSIFGILEGVILFYEFDVC